MLRALLAARELSRSWLGNPAAIPPEPAGVTQPDLNTT